MNVNDWKVSFDNTVMGQVLSFVKALEQVKITSKALDGTVYIQTVGEPTVTATVSVFSSKEEMELMNDAEAAGARISVVYRGVTYLGYIESKLQWQTVYPGKWYNASMNLLIEEEVT